LDIIYPDTKGMQNFNDLPRKVKEFIEDVEAKLELPVTLIGTGPGVKEIIDRR
jgi:adenylosuccinate synthase